MDVTLGPDFCLNRLMTIIQTWLPGTNTSLDQITAAAVGVPGPVVSDTGVVGAPPIMPGWDKFPIRDWLEERLGCPVSLGNDAEFGALGEWAFGAGRGEKNSVYIKVGTGVGAGFLLDGQIYRGTTGSAGEIGHITLEENGPLCSCGNSGCLEALAGGQISGSKSPGRRSKRSPDYAFRDISIRFDHCPGCDCFSSPWGFIFSAINHRIRVSFRHCNRRSSQFDQSRNHRCGRRCRSIGRFTARSYSKNGERKKSVGFLASGTDFRSSPWQTIVSDGCGCPSFIHEFAPHRRNVMMEGRWFDRQTRYQLRTNSIKKPINMGKCGIPNQSGGLR